MVVVKNQPANAGDIRDSGLSSGSGGYPGGGHGNPLQYFCLENPKNREAWWAAVCRVVKSQTQSKWLSTRAQGIVGTIVYKSEHFCRLAIKVLQCR